MKKLPLIICLCLIGCNIKDGKRIFKFGEVEDPNGHHRLLLLYTPMKFGDKEGGYDFHSLVWQTKKKWFWVDHSIITKG
jgi:hypothetical protein